MVYSASSRRSSRSILSRLALKAAILPCCLLAAAPLAHSADEIELLVLNDGRHVLGVVSDADGDHLRVLMQFQGLEIGEMIIAKHKINERRAPNLKSLRPLMAWLLKVITPAAAALRQESHLVFAPRVSPIAR